MRGDIIRASGRLLLIVAAGLLGLLLLVPWSVAEQAVLALSVNGPSEELAVSSGEVRATQSAGGVEAISITSATPSVCEVRGYVWGPSEEPPPEREVVAAVGYLAPGTCTLVASVKATGTTEASEVSESVKVSGSLLPGAGRPLPPLPELVFEPPREAYLGGFQDVQAKSSRPGLRVVSTTPAICSVSPHAVEEQVKFFEVQLKFLAGGTCTLTASLPKTTEHEALEVTKSILVAAATFTSTPPASPAVGGSYELSATSSAGGPVYVGAGGACSLTRPDLEKTMPPEQGGGGVVSLPSETPPKSPVTVYFVKAGTCTVTAGGSYVNERASQSFTVAAGPPEQLSFTSALPNPAVVGGSYWPWVLSSANLEVTFSIATPSVCEIVTGPHGGQHVSLIAAGTCTIDVRVQGSSEGAGPEAEQSFAVQMAPVSKLGPIDTPNTTASLKLVGRPRVDHKTAAIKLMASCTGPGTLRWRFTFEGRRGGAAAGLGVFSTGAMKITRASTPILVAKPTKAALRMLTRAHKHRHGMSVKAVLRFYPSSGASPASLNRSVVVRLA